MEPADQLCDACRATRPAGDLMHEHLRPAVDAGYTDCDDASDLICELCGAHWIMEDGHYAVSGFGDSLFD
jgi:hypothetical protein